ncbi:uncharacterized protein LOC129235177 isoform X2 [Uloborus diversus]|uniref:uncharacterized protein LOC129235177 isoform X2 n=1 Tax=Uloborus diversus TaxID=327109 RepID=UPI00240A03A1|nr:uncharacterized protein LOC129235177 isoform X2 [Uloborus diversus]
MVFEFWHPENLPSEVSKSLDALDSVLDEFEKEGGLHSFKRRRPANKSDSIRKPRNDDIRRSLEVLDNVLAEFDDCLDCWDSMPAFSNGSESMTAATIQSQLVLGENEKEEKRICRQQNEDSVFSFECLPIDGSTSHNSPSEQGKISSAPPIPKRSPTTQLTGDRNSGLFVFPPDSSSLDSYDSIPSDSFTQDSDLSGAPLYQPRQLISGTLSVTNDDELGQADCVSSGVSLSETMESKESSNTLSPFLQRKKMFEDKIAESGSKSPVLDRYRHASLKVRKVNRDYHDSSGPMSLSSSLSPESGFASDESPSQSFRDRRIRPPNLVKVSPPSVDFPMSSPNHAVDCNCQQRIQLLNIKFAETRRLLRENKIKALNQKPPSFVPPPPPIHSPNKDKHFNEREKENFSKPFTLEISRSKSFDSLRNTYNLDVNDVRLQQQKYQVLSEKSSNLKTTSSLSCSCKDTYIAENDVFKNRNSLSKINNSSLCRLCSRSVPTPLSETIEDISNLLPTDALNRPHLGLSYSMEDDLSPGVKEIRHTSTPKTDTSNVKNHKDSYSLSTFSLSASSLGYISSQSDLELSNSLTECDKVPVTSLRSQTLPIGASLTPSPFYSAIDSSHPSDHNDNILIRDQNFNHSSLGAELQLRSCSAPPLPEVEKTKKHFRAFSKKEKKDKKKNEDSLSLKSDLSLDEGVILRKIEAIDGATDMKDRVDKSDRDSFVEKKRRSVWRSILKKK